jgi:deoxyadenosine/deoxycytidine kinase
MTLDKAHHIAVEGPIGAGKTSLARRMAEHLNAAMLFEQPQDNPFLARFYQNPERWALPTQLFFFFQRIDRLAALEHEAPSSGKQIVSDFLLERDPLFARLNLSREEIGLYERIFEASRPVSPPAPDLVIYLQAPVETLMERIRKRGTDAERWISEDYVERVAQRYASFFFQYEAAPLFIVDAEVLNPVDNDDDFRLLMERLDEMRGHREFFAYAG